MNNNIDVLEVMAHYNGLLREKALACATAWGAAEFLRGIGRDCSEAETAYHESVDDFDSLLGLTRAAIAELIEAAKSVEPRDCFMDVHDEVCTFGCCGEVTYHPHAADCWLSRLNASVARVSGGAK